MSNNEAQLAIIQGSKSFSLAARFFPEEHWQGASQLYHWCRHCDDVTDKDQDEMSFLELNQQTQEAFVISPRTGPFRSLHSAIKKHNIPPFYVKEMLLGMQMDREQTRYKSFRDLELYCYRVASTVGLMMCHIMGVFHEKALKHAAFLGMAMQLTNISRDVKEDFENHRNYLPDSLLNKEQLTTENYFMPSNREKLFRVVKRLIYRSERLYKIGLHGLKYLPLRSAFVILVAAKIYRQIGRTILKKGPRALEQRSFVSLSVKIKLIFESILIIGMMIPSRLFNSNKPTNPKTTWTLP